MGCSANGWHDHRIRLIDDRGAGYRYALSILQAESC
jgi:hypothetical protein